MTSRRWSLLLVGKENGLAGRRGSLWLGHPDYYERVEVVEASDYERLSAENEALKAELTRAHRLAASNAKKWRQTHCGNVGAETSKAFRFSREAHEDFCCLESALRVALEAKED